MLFPSQVQVVVSVACPWARAVSLWCDWSAVDSTASAGRVYHTWTLIHNLDWDLVSWIKVIFI